jgi:hypothetical protein
MKKNNMENVNQINNDSVHPIIANSELKMGDKLFLNRLLINEFGNDIDRLLVDMQKFAIEEEHYEIAALIKTYLDKK